jgi:hypothetical protein
MRVDQYCVEWSRKWRKFAFQELSREVQLMRVSHPILESTTNCIRNLSRPRNHKSLISNNMMFYLLARENNHLT